MQSARWQRKLRRLADLGLADHALLLHAFAALAVAQLQLTFVPFKRLVARRSRSAETPGGPVDPALLRRIEFAVTRVAAHVPWRADCLPQALAARALLKRYGHAATIHLGVARKGEDLLAGHAWLTCGDLVVIGGAELCRYTEIHRFSG